MWQSDFQDKLRVRFHQHHSVCSQCCRHKLIIKKLGHCPPARRMQQQLLMDHRHRQHKDRQCYWELRSRSRMASKAVSPDVVCMILDSMGAAKHAWPRATAMLSKELVNFNRPRLTSTTLLVHGHMCLTCLSPHWVSTTSSRSTEIISHALTRLSKERELRDSTIHIQADNCTKEAKNNCLLRALAMWTAKRQVKASQLSFLSSGHSHEDIDAHFALTRSHLEKHQELWTPADFRDSLQSWFDDDLTRRPHEPYRKVFLLSQFRDWTLAWTL